MKSLVTLSSTGRCSLRAGVPQPEPPVAYQILPEVAPAPDRMGLQWCVWLSRNFQAEVAAQVKAAQSATRCSPRQARHWRQLTGVDATLERGE